MKMIYLQKSRKNKKRAILPIAFVLFFLAVALVVMLKAPDPLISLTRSVGSPIWKVRNAFIDRTSFIWNFLHSKKVLIDRNNELVGEIEIMRGELANYEKLRLEYERLLVDYGRDPETPRVIASILVRPPQTPYDTLLLDVGESDGVAVGDRVYSTRGVVLGTVADVTSHTARTILFSSDDVSTPAVIMRNDLALNVRGRGGGSFEIQAPQDTDIVIGDTLILPILGGPTVAHVVDIEGSVTSAFKRILLKGPANISQLRFVDVYTGGR